MSEKRKGVLLLLRDGAKEMETLLRSLDTTRQALLPQIRILEEHHLVTGSNDIYELTVLGKQIIDKMRPLMGTVEVFDVDTDYWGTHNLEFIPSHLLKRIREIGKCKEVKLSLTESYQLNRDVLRSTFMSASFHVLTSFFHPNYPAVFPEMNQKGVVLYIITTRHVLDTMKEYHYEVFDRLLKTGSFNLFLYPGKMDMQVVAYNDYYLLLRLLTSDGHIDVDHMQCSGPDALEWGKELFEHYLKDSVQIREL